MTPFQVVGISLCLLLAFWATRRWRRAQRPRSVSVLGIGLGLVGAITILDPELTTDAARVVGIARGADLLTYVVALAFLGSWFYFFQRLRALSSALTTVVRELALRSPSPPVKGTTEAGRRSDESSVDDRYT